MEPVLFGLAQRLASYLPAVFLGLDLPVGGWFAPRIVGTLIERLGSRRRVNPGAVTLRRNAARTVLTAVGLVTARGPSASTCRRWSPASV